MKDVEQQACTTHLHTSLSKLHSLPVWHDDVARSKVTFELLCIWLVEIRDRLVVLKADLEQMKADS